MDIFIQGKKISLENQSYKATGGEGSIYVKAGQAYKIYHDSSKMIPAGKIKELNLLQQPNVLAPVNVIQDVQGTAIGFQMPYISNTEYLASLFTKGFRQDNSVTPADINALVKRIQDTAKAIHAKQTLIVDANELNFLVDKKFTEVYFIDTDSYKTPSYPATALMESVRDRTVKNNQFTELSDWFSLGVTMFQLYMGAHPYQGRHPDFGKDWVKMMDAGVSVFNKLTRLPPNCQDWSVIPKGHKKWFEAIFEKGERLAPPEPDQVLATAGAITATIISSNDKFVLTLMNNYGSPIQSVQYIDGTTYVYTQDEIYREKNVVEKHAPQAGYTAKRARYDLIASQGDSPVVVEFNSLTNQMKWHSFDRRLDTEHRPANVTGYFIANDRLYTVISGGLEEIKFSNLGVASFASSQKLANVFDNYRIYEGMVVEDMLGICRFTVPLRPGAVKTINIPELNRLRIVGAKYMKGFAVVLAEGDGTYDRYTIVFDKQHDSYTLRKDAGVPMQDINFTVMDKGVCVIANGDTVEIFADNASVKVVPDSPLTGDQKLLSFGNKIYVVNRTALYQLSLK